MRRDPISTDEVMTEAGIDQKAHKEVEIHLAEYQALRTEINHYSQRIDKMSGVYITAIFAIVGYLIRPDKTFEILQYLQRIKCSGILTALVIFIPILNSFLLIRMGSFLLGTYAISQYIHYSLRPRLNMALKTSVLHWDDEPTTDAKRKWISLRSSGQLLFTLIAEVISIAILYGTSYAISRGYVLVTLYIASSLCVIGSVISLVRVANAGRRFHSMNPTRDLGS